MLDENSLEEWRANPVTTALLDILQHGYADNKAGLLEEFWQSGNYRQEDIGRAKAQEELMEDLKTATAEEWNEWNEQFRGQ